MSIICGGTTWNGTGAPVDFSGFVQPDDFLFLQMVEGWIPGSSPAVPSGWTLIHSESSFHAGWTLAWRVWQTGDPTTVTFAGGVTGVTAYRYDPATGALDELNARPSGGDATCHLALEPQRAVRRGRQPGQRPARVFRAG